MEKTYPFTKKQIVWFLSYEQWREYDRVKQFVKINKDILSGLSQKLQDKITDAIETAKGNLKNARLKHYRLLSSLE